MKIDKITPEMSELAGIFAADGSMQKNHISFWGNIVEDKDYYISTLTSLFKRVFNFDVKVREKVSNSVCGFYVCDKSIIACFNYFLGYPLGSKSYIVRVPRVVINSSNPKVWSAFLRGFSDGDGSLNFDKRYGSCQNVLKFIHTYPRIQIRSVSKNLISDLSLLMDRLKLKHKVYEITPSRLNEQKIWMVQLCGKKRVEDWMDLVGFNNPVQLTRYEIFKKHGFVPPRTSLSERKLILKGLDPLRFYSKRTRSLVWKARLR